jgi:hypothetical protein
MKGKQNDNFEKILQTHTFKPHILQPPLPHIVDQMSCSS